MNITYNNSFPTEKGTDLGFRDNRGRPITSPITVDPATRSSGIAYFVSRSTVDPMTVDPRITRTSITIEFWLALPLPYLKPSSLLNLSLIMPVAIFSSTSTAPLPPLPKLLQPFPYVKLIWMPFSLMILVSLAPKPALTLFLIMVLTVILCSPQLKPEPFFSALSFLSLFPPLPFCRHV